MKFPTTCEEFLTTLKAKSKVEGRQPEKSKSESLDPFNYEEVLKVLGEKGKKCTSSLSSPPYSPVSFKNTVLRPNWQYKASTAEMAENRYS